ncbi:polyketide synthase [Streptomyces longwoodensis]|uniref:polyketide synthase n=1 Tax=Streptomyces longwoodensis TaxID=68231 RepID=UPI0033E1660E
MSDTQPTGHARSTPSAGPVTAERTGPVALVTMCDPERRNAMTPALVAALGEVLERVTADPAVRVVVAAGLPDVFSSGAAREYLMDQDRGELEPFVRAFARCPLPVVAAMRGHALGGGLTQGLYADVPVLSERSVYAANFLTYGLVPEYGTTWLLPARLGHALGAEMLWTARGYRGAELRRRSAPVQVVPHEQVLPRSLEIAERIARAPRRSLELLKGQLATQLLAAGDAAVEVELGPHLEAWNSPDLRRLVADRYGRPEEVWP